LSGCYQDVITGPVVRRHSPPPRAPNLEPPYSQNLRRRVRFPAVSWMRYRTRSGRVLAWPGLLSVMKNLTDWARLTGVAADARDVAIRHAQSFRMVLEHPGGSEGENGSRVRGAVRAR
jgi:hypothetical protein